MFSLQSTVCDKIMEQLGQHDVDHRQRQVVTISLDSFYKPLTNEEQAQAKKGQYNFDHPGKVLKQAVSTCILFVSLMM